MSNVSIDTGGNGVYVGTPANANALSFKNTTITSANGYGIWLANGGSGVSGLVFGSATEPVVVNSFNTGIYFPGTIAAGGKADFNNVTVTSTSTSNGAHGIALVSSDTGANTSGAHTFSNVKITTAGGYGLYLAAGTTFDNITIRSKGDAIRSTRTNGFTQTYTNLDLASTNGYGISFVSSGTSNTGGITFGTASGPIKIAAATAATSGGSVFGGGIYVTDAITGPISINNATITCYAWSTSGADPGGCIWLADNVRGAVSLGTTAAVSVTNTHTYGYAFYSKGLTGLTANQLSATGGGGLFFGTNVTGTVNIAGTRAKPVLIQANGTTVAANGTMAGVALGNQSGTISLSNFRVNAPSVYGIYALSDSPPVSSIADFEIASKFHGIHLNAQNINGSISNGVITITDGASNGINLGTGGSSSSTQKSLSSLTINLPASGSSTGISLGAASSGTVQNICTSGGSVGLYTGSNTTTLSIKNNYFTGYGSRGLQLDSGWAKTSNINGNCFNTATTPMASAAQTNTALVSGNYWQGVTGSYTSGNIKDSSALASCPLTSNSCYSTPPVTVLVGDWHMDEAIWSGSASEVVDSSSSAYHGTAMNGPNTAYGQVCAAGKFDGVNDYIALPTVNKDFSTVGISMAAWVKGQASGVGRTWERIFDLASGQYNMLLLARNATSNDLTFEIYDTNTGNSCGKNTITGFFDGNMHHVVATADASKVVKIYKDGVLALTGSTTCLPGNISRSSSFIGRSNYSSDAYFKGVIDEAKVWTGPLTASDVATGYANEKAGKSWDGSARTCSAMLVAEYRLEETSWSGNAGEILDSVGTAHGKTIGKVTPTKTTPAVNGSPGTCGYASMNETSSAGGAIEVTGLPVSTTAGDKTSVAFWMYWNGSDLVMPMGWGKHDLFFWSDRFGFNTGNSDVFGISGASAKLANGWHHVVAVFTNGSVSGNAIYIDGVAQAVSQQINSPNTANAVVQSTAHFGGWTNDSGYRMGARIDEIKVYQGAVNQAQVNALYAERHSCASISVDWRLDEAAWTGASGEVKDATSSAFHGTAQGGATTTTGKVCRAGSFDGSNDAVSLASISTDFSSGITFAAWAQGDATCVGCGRTYERLIDLGNGAANDNILWMRRNQTNDLSFEVYLGGASCGQYPVANMFDGNLHHYAVTLDSVRNIAVYRDGVLVSSGTYACLPNKVTRNSNYLGKSNWSGDAYFKGMLDEVKIWNYGLSAAEISTGYANENAGKRWDGGDSNCGAVPVLKARMDESVWSGAGSVVDTSGKSHNGTPMNGAKTVTCGSKQVGYFSNGAYVDFGNHTDLSPQASSAQAITVGAWVKADYANLVGSPTLAGGGYQALFNKIVKPGDGYKYEWLLHVYTNSLPGDRFPLEFWTPGGNSYGSIVRSANIGWTEDTAGTCSGSVSGEHKPCWHFVAISWDYANKKWATYLIRPDLNNMSNSAASGIREDYQTDVMAQGPPSDPASPPTNLWIGTADFYGNRHFVGMMRGAIITRGAMTQAELRDWANSTWPDPCDNPISAPSKLNAVDVGKNAVSGVIGTKIAGAPISLDIYALKADNSGVDTTWGGDVGVDLVDGASCSAASATIATATSAATLAAGAKTSFALPSVAEAYKNLRVRLRYPATGTATLVACSGDNFALRPNAFGLLLQDQDWATAGTARSLTGVSATAGPVHKAAKPFTMTATAYNASSVITSNYSGSIPLTLASTACAGGTACTSTLGVLSDTSGTVGTLTLNASSGTLLTSLKYSEVGAFSLQVQDKTFAAVDASDGTTADCAGLWICSPATNVGRFVPDHYDITALTPAPQFQTFGSACANRSFTYMGQSFGFADNPSAAVAGNLPYLVPQARVTAKNADNQTTANFKGALWRLKGLTGGMRSCQQTDVGSATRSSCTMTVTYSLPSINENTLTSSNDGSGVYVWPYGDPDMPRGLSYAFKRKTPLKPFNVYLSTGISISDTSESTYTGLSGSSSWIVDTQGSTPTWQDVAFDAGNEIRFGRLRMVDNYGSERLDLPMSVQAQYWTGARFANNTADQCTSLAASNVALSDGSLAASKVSVRSVTNPLVQGQGFITLAAPSGAATGDVRVCLDLGNDPSAGPLCAAATSAGQTHLQTGAAYDTDPYARATFGVGGGAARRLFYMMH